MEGGREGGVGIFVSNYVYYVEAIVEMEVGHWKLCHNITSSVLNDLLTGYHYTAIEFLTDTNQSELNHSPISKSKRNCVERPRMRPTLRPGTIPISMFPQLSVQVQDIQIQQLFFDWSVDRILYLNKILRLATISDNNIPRNYHQTFLTHVSSI